MKPGETYPFRVFVRNYTASAASGAAVSIPAPDGTTFTHVTTATGNGTAAISGGTITWNVGSVPAAAADGTPALKTLVVEAKADTLGQDPQIVWKNLSSTATLTYTGGPALTSTEPRAEGDPAEGDASTPPATATGRSRSSRPTTSTASTPTSTPASRCARRSTRRTSPGSTFNLYQENSYGQLFPNGTVPSAGLTTAGWDVQWKSARYQGSGFQFTTPDARRRLLRHDASRT